MGVSKIWGPAFGSKCKESCYFGSIFGDPDFWKLHVAIVDAGAIVKMDMGSMPFCLTRTFFGS